MTYKQMLGKTLEEFETTLLSVKEENICNFISLVQAAQRIFIAGRGRSGLQMSGFAMRLMHLGFQVHVVGDVTTPSIQQGDLLILGSGSGRTASLVSFAEKAKAQNAMIVLFTIAASSPLHDKADISFCLPASTPKLDTNPNPKSLLPMGSLFEFSMGILCELIVLNLMTLMNAAEEEMFTRHANME